jgi:benzoate-CoA ligase family protein
MTTGDRCNASLLVDRNLEAGRGAKVAYLTADDSLTYEGLYRQINRMGRFLRELGVRREQRVLLALDDTTVFPIAFLGALRIGAVPVPVSVLDTPEHFRHFVEDSYAEVVVCDSACLEGLQSALKGRELHYVARGAHTDGAIELDGALAAQDDELTALATHPDDMAFWLYSSGSTGMPKGVVHLHRNIEVTCETFAREVLNIAEEDRIFSTTKLYHAYGLGNSLSFPLYFGATAILLDGPPRAERLLSTLREQQPTVFCSVPALYGLLAEDSGADQAFDSIRLCISAAEPLPTRTFDRWRERFGREIVEGIGSTEMLQAYCSNRPGEAESGTTGRAVPGYELRLTNEVGAVLEGPAVGALEVRGDSCAAFYWHEHEKARHRMRGEWYATGDRFERRGDGSYVYLGRTDDMFKVGGLWVSPMDMERVLLEHPAVAGVGVVGVSIEERLRIVAFVERVEEDGNEEVLAEELRAMCAERMREHEYPHIVRFLEALPRTLTGKPQRFKLRELIELETEPVAAQPRWETPASLEGDPSVEHPREPGQEQAMLQLVMDEVVAVLGSGSPASIDPGRDFKGLGLDSVGAVQLRNRLSSATGLELPSTLAFDHPTPVAVASLLSSRVHGYEPRSLDSPVGRRHSEEPIAIVGMSCRFPGGVRSPEQLWELVASGTDAIGGLPSDRGWELESLFDPDPDHPGTSYVREGGFLYDAPDFDPNFFGISPREALSMDPQQRLLLEASWEALEDGRLNPASLRGSRTGVFAGVMYHDYGERLSGATPADLEAYLGMGSAGSVASGRVAYALGLEGPAVTLDTACSSSLVALHMACGALRAGECELALAGGVTVLATPRVFIEFSRQRGLARNGRCKSYADAADGTSWSEGVGVLVLERLSQARREGHRVLAVVRGSAINQDGASNGLTAPNGPSQQRVIRQALANAGLAARQVDAVDGHGTGTPLGDPIEAQALLATYGQKRDAEHPLWLGSVKSNIGHTQAAAGVASVIKMAMALRHEQLPKTLHVDEPSRQVDWSAGGVSLLSEPEPWMREDEPRRAGVSSFGVSGTNAHVILEEAPQPLSAPPRRAQPVLSTGEASESVLIPWALSGRNDDALRAQAQRLSDHVRAHPELDPASIGYSLAQRPELERRAVVLGADREQLIDGLSAAASGDSSASVTSGVLRGESVVFLFPGQGSQWPGMASDLLRSSPVFSARIAECERALEPYVDWSLEAVLRGEEGAPSLERVDVVQPVLFALMVSLAALWRACGVRPAAVIGHSQGEIAAAHVAGGLSLSDAARIAAVRSQALSKLAGRGGMVSLSLDLDAVRRLLEPWGERIALAAVNGPSSIVVSGDCETLDGLLEQCETQEIRARRIAVDYAAHSMSVEAIREELLDACASIQPRSGSIPFYSTVTGGLLDTEKLDADYWYRNLRETVQLAPTVRTLLDRGCGAFIEMSPHPVLAVGVQETVDEAPEGSLPVGVLGSLRRDEDGWSSFSRSLAQAWVHGAQVQWGALFGAEDAELVDLPTYAFQRQRYWLEQRAGATDLGAAGLEASTHPLLAAKVSLAGGEDWLFTGHVSLQSHPWLADHAVFGVVLIPGTALLELALHVGQAVGYELVEELAIEKPLVLEDDGGVQLQVTVSQADGSGSRTVNIYAIQEPRGDDPEQAREEWVRHASGTLVHDQAGSAQEEVHGDLLGVWPPAGSEPLPLDGAYERLADIGLEYGPGFQGIRAAWRRGDDLFAEVALAPTEEMESARFAIDPALLDSALHVIALADVESDEPLRLPFSWSGVRLHGSGARCSRVALTRTGEGSVSLSAVDELGATAITAKSLLMRGVSAEQIQGMRATGQDSMFRVQWTELAIDVGPGDGDVEGGLSGGSLSGDWVVLDLESNTEPGLEDHGQPENTSVAVSDLTSLLGAGKDGEELPGMVFLDCRGGVGSTISPFGEQLPLSARSVTVRVLKLLQEWLAEERFADSLLAIVTCGAVGVAGGEEVPGLVNAPLWGLVRSAQSEFPGRLALVDVDRRHESWSMLCSALGSTGVLDESQLAVREGVVYAPRFVHGTAGALSVPGEGTGWRLAPGRGGTLEGISVLEAPVSSNTLESGQVRVEMRAAGVNFRDVVTALGVVPLRGEWDSIGSEGAGVVLEVGPGVEDLAAGDRVMGLFDSAFGPTALADRRLIVPIPDGWSFVQAAAVPVAFLTAYYGLVDLGGVKAGERLLVHSAAGGVGMAAVQLAHWLEAEVLGTASPGKWSTLRELGLDEANIASSRDLQFRESFLAPSDGRGIDLVLNSLAGEFVDASLDLVCEGGRFLEMGKTDVRDPQQIAERWSGVTYRAFDLLEAGPERIQRMLLEILELFQQGVLEHLPVRAWDLRRAPEALRFMARAQHVGKIALTLVPAARGIGRDGTVLITGGTGVLGSLVATHLAAQHGVGGLLLASRQGPEAPGAAELEATLVDLGVEVSIVACDVTDRQQVRGLLASVPGDRPLRAVVHAAGALDDGSVASLTPEHIDHVFGVKVDGAWHLHELTRDINLDAFVLFSSLAGVLGGSGQANYSAANTFLDALAAHRRAQGLPAVSMAWGWWAKETGLTEHLRELDLARMRRSGIAAMSSEEGLALFDEAWTDADALTVPARLDHGALQEQARTGALPSMLRGLVRSSSRRSLHHGEGGLLAQRLRGASLEEARKIVVALVRGEVAAVLGHSSPEAIDRQRAFKELGFDSLLSVELRNRLNAATGMRLSATLAFDYPTVASLADHVLEATGAERVNAPRSTAKVRAVEEPLAIVGMGCRYPGGALSPTGLWDLVCRGGDAISRFPLDRGWQALSGRSLDVDDSSESFLGEGGFLYDAAEFDASFFGIGPREALAMDPQQRLLLEVSWEALEDAGIDPRSLKESQTGVFAGISSQDYQGTAYERSPALEGYGITGSSTSVISGRIAYVFGLEGPAVTIDTACSSSLVAMHLACQALRVGECSLALASGVTVLGTPTIFLDFMRQGGLAPDGRCKPFADSADGTGFSEGVGVVVLERLSDAQRHGHRVLAVVRGSAVNQDGASNGLTAPNGPSQQRVILQALANAGLSTDDVEVVEAHGTGTTLGDPIEAQALLATYGQDRPADRPLWLGSVKSNLGHTQAAAGVAGVIKMVMAMRHGVLPRSLHIDEPSSKVDWASGTVSLLSETRDWERNGGPRRAGVSSFGISGTNAHLILEEQSQIGSERHTRDLPTELDLLPWVISARSEPALRAQAARLQAHMVLDAALDPVDVGFSLAGSRSVFEHRCVVVGRDRDELLAGLGQLAAGGESGPTVAHGFAGVGETGLAFLFTGQGAQRAGMGRELYRAFPVFERALDELCAGLEEFLGHSLQEVMWAESDSTAAGLLDQTAFTQAALFALEVALFRLLESLGVRPDFLVGHSIGELTAAHVAGVLNLQDACALVGARGRLMQALPPGGAMVAIQASEQELLPELERLGESVALAAVNGPRAVVLSGDAGVLELADSWGAKGRKTKRLQVSHAFHSHRMDGMLEEFLQVAEGLTFSAPRIPIVSNLTGKPVVAEEICAPSYWARHVRHTVRFADAIGWLDEHGVSNYLELGPDGVLSAMTQECLVHRTGAAAAQISSAGGGAMPISGEAGAGDSERGSPLVVPVLRGERSEEPRAFFEALGRAWVGGVNVGWSTVFEGSNAQRVDLPTYAFQRERFWLGSERRHLDDAKAVGLASTDHPLLGAAVELPGEGWLFTGRLSLHEHPWLADHVVLGRVLLAGTAFLELALHTGSRLGCDVVRELTLQAPLVLGEQDAVQLQVRVEEVDESGLRSLTVNSRVEPTAGGAVVGDTEAGWVCHAVGLLASAELEDEPGTEATSGDAQNWPPTGAEPVAVDDVYDRLVEKGLDYGPVFQGLSRAWRLDGELFAEVSLPEDELDRPGSFELHPALLDAVLHVLVLDEQEVREGGVSSVRLPFSWSDVRLIAGGGSIVRARLSSTEDGSVSIVLADARGRPVASVGSLISRPASVSDLGGGIRAHQDALLGIEWIELPLPAPVSADSSAEWATCSVGLSEVLRSSGGACGLYRDLGAIGDAVSRDELKWGTVLLDAGDLGSAPGVPVGEEMDLEALPDAVKTSVQRMLACVQQWLEDERLSGRRLAVVTHGAVAGSVEEGVTDLPGAGVWGLMRSVQSENPERFILVDCDGEDASWQVLGRALALGEPQLVLREGGVRVPRLASAYAGAMLTSPSDTDAWRLGLTSKGTLESVALLGAPEAERPLGPGQVRIGMRAAGLNFRDVLLALGVYPGEASIGGEGAGVVLEVGPEVSAHAPGDFVMGLLEGAIGTVAVADSRLVVPIPEGWSFVQAASIPVAFATAYYGLVDLGQVKAGERLLVHAAAGGVGMAAVQLGRYFDAEVFGTASPEKWEALRALGLDDRHIASSRTLDFKAQFLEETNGQGMNVVLDSLAGELVDASLDLLPEGGRFLEMGKADIRDPRKLASRDVTYRAFDLMEAGPERLQEILLDLVELFEDGVLELSPITTWNVRRAQQAFRHMSQARHVGKNVLRLPTTVSPEGTVLITGGTGTLGALVARHLVAEHQARHLLLVGRQGLARTGARELVEELSLLGAKVTVAACDVSNREQVELLLAGIPRKHPLDAIVHAAGVLDDGIVGSLTPEQVDRVLAPKVTGAWNLHELTREMDLSAFVMFSSLAATLGGSGQANYAAANAFLDALAVHRRTRGLTGTSIAWGLWEKASEMTGNLGELDRRRMAEMGVLALSDEEALELLDAACAVNEACVVSARLDMSALRAKATTGGVHALLRGMVRVRSRRSAGASDGSLAALLAQTSPDRHAEVVLELVCAQTARALGHSGSDAVDPQRTFKDLGFDSLAGVELRNRIVAETGIRMPATLVFDHPTPSALAGRVLEELEESSPRVAVPVHRATGADEPIAIVGMNCRYPGGVSSPEQLWDLVRSGTDAIGAFPSDRGWDVEDLYDPDPDHAGTTYAREGGFLYDATEFDAAFFEIGPREATAMDPQQRLLLEVCWEAFERAEIDPISLRGSDTGVFTGVIHHDYGTRMTGVVSSDLEAYRGIGSAGSVVSGRAAYAFGFEGPAVTVDTACSSSLVALHWACQALRSGECSMALAGGVTVLSTPSLFVEFSRQRGLASDGRCKSFADGADGVGWGEGVGVLVLERLSDAHRHGHKVLALVRGSAINQDGASNGLTAPNGPSQQRVIRQALASAELSPQQVSAVEAHGTGTTLGDPIEAQALLAIYGQNRPEGEPLWLGSVKSNIGHTQAAAGVAGVIKTVMAMRHERLPRTLHVDSPSSQVDWDSGSVSLLTEEVPWRGNGEPRRSGVSSFGISGTNAHVILEEPPSTAVAPQDDRAVPVRNLEVVPWVISAKHKQALHAQADRLVARLGVDPGLRSTDVGLSLASRAELEHRAVVLGADREALRAALTAHAEERPLANVIEGVARSGRGSVAVMFTGQGAQYRGMGAKLHEAFPVFREAFDEVCLHMDEPLKCSLSSIVLESEDESSERCLLDETAFTQTGLFALEVALFRLGASHGLRPDFVIGHSIGELVAAYVAGVFSLRDACKLVAARGRLMGGLPDGGAMVAVQACEQEALESLRGFEDRLALAAINGPESVVFSGEEQTVLDMAATWEQRGRKTKRLEVSHAFHSPRMDSMLEEFRHVAAEVSYDEPRIRVVSNLTGEAIGRELCTPEYWVRHVRETVRFADGVHWLARQGVSTFVELGPDGVLSSMVEDCLASIREDGATGTVGVDDALSEGPKDPPGLDREVVAIPVLRKGRGETHTLMAGLARLWVRGVGIDWRVVFDGCDAQHVELPTYAFQRERYWLDSVGAVGNVKSVGQASMDHPLLGAAVALADAKGWLFTGRLSLREHPWLSDHAVMGRVVLPGTAFLELAAHSGAHLGLGVVRELILQAPLMLDEHGRVQLQVALGEADESGARSLSIHSRVEDALEDSVSGNAEWTCHAIGSLSPSEGDEQANVSQLAWSEDAVWPPAGAEPLPVEGLYDQLAVDGLDYGPVFQGLLSAWGRDGEVFAEVTLPEPEHERASSFALHPALLDAALHAGALIVPTDESQAPDGVRLPFCWNDVTYFASGASSLRVRVASTGEDTVSVAVADLAGRPIANIRSLVTRRAPAAELARPDLAAKDMLHLDWRVISSNKAAPAGLSGTSWALVGAAESALDLELAGSEMRVDSYTSFSSLSEAIATDAAIPDVVLLDCALPVQDLPAAAHAGATRVLNVLQAWLAEERLSRSLLVVLTSGAVATHPGEDLRELAASAIWGLVSSAQSEHPGRLVLVDVDGKPDSIAALAAAIAHGEPRVAIRDGELLVARLTRRVDDVLRPTEDAPRWRLDTTGENTLESLVLVDCPEVSRQLEHGEVRVGVRAAGLNFRDVLIALGVYPGQASIGSEAAGVVLEVGPGVEDLAVGERVMGLFSGAFAQLAIADSRLLTRIPHGWSFTQAASVPLVFLTAYYALTDLGALQPHERLLVHSAAGGVGMAAVQLARHIGAEVFGTASPAKWDVLSESGMDSRQIGSSRDLSFGKSLLDATSGEGMDVVLNSLAGEFVDASLELLPRGGRFLEMGKADVRDPTAVAAERDGVLYRSFDLMDAGPKRIKEMLAALTDLFEQGALKLPPIRTWDVRHAPRAFKFMSQARHVGKIVLTLPARRLDPCGTVLITGGTGGLGALLARHLVVDHGVRNLLLVSRAGEAAAGAPGLREELSELGATVSIASCDVVDRKQLEELISSIGAESPLRGVIHAAGVLDDGVIGSLSSERLGRVLAPKLDGAWHLHDLTRHMDLDAFVLFSSAAATLGGPGQGNYAAANAFLDALAAHRRASGLVGVAMAWGPWEQASGMTAGLGQAQMKRISGSGLLPLSEQQGLELFDAAYTSEQALVMLARLDSPGMRAIARDGALPRVLEDLIGTPLRPVRVAPGTSSSLAERLAVAPVAERNRIALERVRAEAAAVLGHASPESLDPAATFKELGFDSLAGVELRNRLAAASAVLLPSTLVFDYPTPEAVARHLLEEISAHAEDSAGSVSLDVDELQRTLSSLSAEQAHRSGIAARLQSVLSAWAAADDSTDTEDDLTSATDEEMFELIDREFGVS